MKNLNEFTPVAVIMTASVTILFIAAIFRLIQLICIDMNIMNN